MVASPVVEALHCRYRVADDFALGGVVDMVVVQCKRGVVSSLDVGRNVPHQGVEVLGPLHQADREDQLGVLLVPGLNGYLVLGEQIPGAEAQLQGVA